MKNLHKLAFGILVGALAIGFSAFKNADKESATTARYYNIRSDHAPSTDPSDFRYVDGTNDDCLSGSSTQCSVQWTTTNAPSVGQSPAEAGSPSIVSGSSQPGMYDN